MTYQSWHDTGVFNVEIGCRANDSTSAYFRVTVDVNSVVGFFKPTASASFNNSFFIISAGATEVLGSQSHDGPFTISMFSTDGSSAAILHGLVDRDGAGGTCTFYGAISAN